MSLTTERFETAAVSTERKKSKSAARRGPETSRARARAHRQAERAPRREHE